MKTFPLQSLTLAQAQQKQFALVDTLCRHFPGADFLAGGDSGLVPGLNQPRVTQRVEKVLADVFHAEAAVLVQGYSRRTGRTAQTRAAAAGTRRTCVSYNTGDHRADGHHPGQS